MQYIGHLDILRFFQKANRRAGVNIAYTQGFSPHQILSFASPLGIGMTSRGEYLDAFLDGDASRADLMEKLNAQMPEGMRIEDIKLIRDETRHSNAMSLVTAASYILRPREAFKDIDLKACLEKYYQSDSLIAVKETKKSSQETDIKPLIYELRLTDEGLYMLIKTGSENNLKPELVMTCLTGIECDRINTEIERIDMYGKGEDGELVSLNDMGELF